jgi:hypothetical protein
LFLKAATDIRAQTPLSPARGKGTLKTDEVYMADKKVDEKKMVKVRFMNIEDPKVGIDFSFEGEKYSLKDGEIYDLPDYIVRHLNGLSIPTPHYEANEATGMVTHVSDSRAYRFSCVPV